MFTDLMKNVSQENLSSSTSETKAAELVIFLDGLRIDPTVLSQSRDLLGEATSANSPLSEGIRARIRIRNNPESLRSLRSQRELRVS